MSKQDLIKMYDYYIEQKAKDDKSEKGLKSIKFLELALLRECIDKLLKESEA